MQKHSLAGNSRYKTFVRDRNKALEKIHLQTQLRMSAIIHEVLLGIKDLVRSRYRLILSRGIYTSEGKAELQRLEFDIQKMFSLSTPHLIELQKSMRRQVYTLAYAGESEAIGQAIGSKATYNLPKQKIADFSNSETFTGGSIEQRVQLIVNRLTRKIMDAVELSATIEDDDHILNGRLKNILPKARRVSTNQHNVTVGTKLTEADHVGPKEDMSVGYVDDENWEEIVDAYKEEFIPGWRGPDESYTIKTKTGAKEEVYAWELEQEVTQDFVYQVRLGQVDAAKENGINDYVWVAIVDNRTDDCCLWRDGLTTAEIERKLKTDRKDDECQSIVPPAHFNCRCELAPMVDEMPERPEENTKDFEDWINT